MFDLDKIRRGSTLDKIERAFTLLQRGYMLLVLLIIIGRGIYQGLLTKTLSGFVSWFASAIAGGLVIAILFLGVKVWLYGINRTIDWLTSQFGKYPQVRQWIIIPFVAVLTLIPVVLVFMPAFWSISDNLVKAVVFLYALVLPPALLSLIREAKEREWNKQITTMMEITPSTSIPLLSRNDVLGAYKMSVLYVVLHCYENSARRLVEKVLLDELGKDWWEQAASDSMKNFVKGRKESEEKKRWLSPRGQVSPLYYLEWGDLEKLIHKYDRLFLPHVGELRFVQSRFGDLESLRNIVAHHGVLPSEDDFQRVKLSFRDWCRQIKV